jgi:hypothetical protein
MTEIYCNKIISKYTYRINEEENEMFLFELVLKKFNQNKNLKLRRIKNSRVGKLISTEDNIIYNDIKKIIVSAIDINNPNKDINAKCILNHSNKHTLILKNNLFIDFFDSNGFLESNYNITPFSLKNGDKLK